MRIVTASSGAITTHGPTSISRLAANDSHGRPETLAGNGGPARVTLGETERQRQPSARGNGRYDEFSAVYFVIASHANLLRLRGDLSGAVNRLPHSRIRAAAAKVSNFPIDVGVGWIRLFRQDGRRHDLSGLAIAARRWSSTAYVGIPRTGGLMRKSGRGRWRSSERQTGTILGQHSRRSNWPSGTRCKSAKRRFGNG